MLLGVLLPQDDDGQTVMKTSNMLAIEELYTNNEISFFDE